MGRIEFRFLVGNIHNPSSQLSILVKDLETGRRKWWKVTDRVISSGKLVGVYAEPELDHVIENHMKTCDPCYQMWSNQGHLFMFHDQMELRIMDNKPSEVPACPVFQPENILVKWCRKAILKAGWKITHFTNTLHWFLVRNMWRLQVKDIDHGG